MLTETYTSHSTISYKQLTREFTRNRGGSKCCIAKLSKVNPNINQPIKSTVSVARFTTRASVAQARSEHRPRHTRHSQKCLGPHWHSSKKGRFRHQAVNLAHTRRIRAWENSPLRLKECQVQADSTDYHIQRRDTPDQICAVDTMTGRTGSS